MKITLRALTLLLLLSATFSSVSAQPASTTSADSSSSTASFAQITAAPVTPPVQSNSKKQSTTTTTAVPATNINTVANPTSTSPTTTLAKPKNHLPTSLTQNLKAVAASEQLPQTQTENSAPCGYVIDREGNKAIIEDCSNPFASNEHSFIGELRIGRELVTNAEVVPVPTGGTNSFYYYENDHCEISGAYYKYVDGNWVFQFYNQDLYRNFPTPDELSAYIHATFPDPTKRYKYFVYAEERYDDSGVNLTYEEQEEFDKTVGRFVDNYAPVRNNNFVLTEGQYAFIYSKICLGLSTNNTPGFLMKVREFFIPTAYAYSAPPGYGDKKIDSTLTFEVVEDSSVSPAQVCGDIVDEYGGRYFVENCNNSFNSLNENLSYSLQIGTSSVVDNGSIAVPIGGSKNFTNIHHSNLSAVERMNYCGSYNAAYEIQTHYYKRVAGNLVYRFSENDLYYEVYPSEDEIQKYINNTFTDQEKRDKYFIYATGGGYYSDLSSEEHSEYSATVEEFLYNQPPARDTYYKLTDGTYVITTTVDCRYTTPPSHLYSDKPLWVHDTLTVHIEEGGIAAGEISSILFFPGIQASRLYTEGFVLGPVEDRVWEPVNNTDVRALRMSDSGESVNDIYTKDVIEKIDVPLGKNIYANFLQSLQEFAEKEEIKTIEAFPYDWRYDVFDIVQNGTKYEDRIVSPIEKVEEMAANSKTGKVTLVGHSNGGLLIKALMIELEKQGKAGLVDKIIFIGTPHLGAPKAIGTVLHGYDQKKAGGWVVDDVVAREVIRNLPGVYNLLPSETYLNRTTDSVVTFTNSPATQAYLDAYGSRINTFAALQQFLINAEGNSERNAVTYHDKKDAVNIPSEANWDMLAEAKTQHALLDGWQVPTGISVYSVIGVGNITPSAITYKTVNNGNCSIGYGCVNEYQLKESVQFSKQGDETVMSLSAAHQPGEKYYVDLHAYNLDEELGLSNRKQLDFSHVNLTEVDSVQLLLESFLKNDTINNQYVSTTEPRFNTKYNIEKIDSPVNMVAVDEYGNQTGLVSSEVVEEIPDSEYIEFGDSKYIITPAETDTTTELTGTGTGSYTLTLETLVGDTQTTNVVLSNIPVTPGLSATYQKVDGTYNSIKTDSNSDGVVDKLITLDGVITTVLEDVEQETNSGHSSTQTAVSRLLRPTSPSEPITQLQMRQAVQLLLLARTANLPPDLRMQIEERVRGILQVYIKENYGKAE